MERIGVRALQQHASAVLKRVRGGESLEVTDRGRPVALLVPIEAGGIIEQLQASGRLVKAKGDLLAIEPLPASRRGDSASQRLRRMRESER
jgi:prevent-host-death family protein